MSASLIVSQLKTITKDYNYWDSIALDGQLTIGRTKLVFDPLKLDLKLRRKAGLPTPSGQVIMSETHDIDTIFRPKIDWAYVYLQTAMNPNNVRNYAEVENKAEAFEFLVQLRNVFVRLAEPKYYSVLGHGQEKYSQMIAGRIDAETVYMATLIVPQTYNNPNIGP